MWFHAKKIERNTQKINIADFKCKFGSRAKSPKKTDHLIAIYSIFGIGMVYFGCLKVNPHIQAVQNMCGSRSLPYFPKKKKLILGVAKKTYLPQFSNLSFQA